MSIIRASESDIERFASYVDRLPSGCHFWTGARSRGDGNAKWYGSFWVGGRVVRAHRFACEVLGGIGPLPDGWHRDHKCCFSLCVNFSCIEYVTHEENERRRKERDRLRAIREGRIKFWDGWTMAEMVGAD